MWELAAWRLHAEDSSRARSRAPLALHRSLSADTFTAIFDFVEAEPGAAWRLLLVKQRVSRAGGPLAAQGRAVASVWSARK